MMDDRRPDYPFGSQPTQQSFQQPFQQLPALRPFAQPMQQPILGQDAQMLTPAGFKPLSREEREEARRIAAEAGFSFDGYQVVRREFFSHIYDPTLTIKGSSIVFNNACISKMDQVVYVQVLVNPTAEKLVIRPCEEGARDAVRWCIAKDDKRKSREITCRMFTAKLYEMMGWETLYRYKLQGTRIDYHGEQLYVFDLTSTEIFLPAVKDPGDPEAKKRRGKTVFPADWRDSFGIPVQEHAQTTQINLLDGYGFVDVSGGQDDQGGEKK